MTERLYKFLLNLILPFIFYGCHSSSSTETSSNGNIQDTLTTNIVISDNQPDSIGLSSTGNQAGLREEKIASLSELYKRCRKKASVFTVNPNRDTVIKCKEGTLISIPANSFETIDGQLPANGNIKLSVNEYYSVSDMLLANLTTSSNGSMIETGGMFYISATEKDSNDSLKLKKGKDLTFALPNFQSKNMAGMQVFNGVHDSAGVNWEAKSGMAGFAQQWINGRRDLNIIADNYLVFPDVEPKKLPTLNSSQSYTAELLMPIRDVFQNNSITRSAIGYIDTMGMLRGYLAGNKKRKFKFETNYTPTFSENIRVNVAVSFRVQLKKKEDVNMQYLDKLLKMGKCNPDSLVAVKATFIPVIKRMNFENIKPDLNYYTISVSSHKKRLNQIKKMQRAYQEHVKQLEASATANINNAREYLLLSTQSLGWINCDRFYDNPNKTNYLVKLEERTSLLIVFNNIRSIIPCDSKGIFHDVPLGEKITIVALKADQGKLLMAMHETVISNTPFESLHFNPVSLSEYKSKLQKLNSI